MWITNVDDDDDEEEFFLCSCVNTGTCPETNIKLKRRLEKAASSLAPFRLCNDDVLQDMVLDILSHLPAAFLFGVIRRVCKPWAALVSSSSYFADKQLQHSKPGLLLERYNCRTRFLDIKDDGDFAITDLHSSLIHGKHEGDRCFLDSCDGLALYHHTDDDVVYLENPLTMRVTQVPCPIIPTRMSIPLNQRLRPLVAIARNPRMGQVKLFYYHYVRLDSFQKNMSELFVLTLGTDNSWRKITTMEGIGITELVQAHSLGKYVCLVGYSEALIINADDETTRNLPLPPRPGAWIKAENCMYLVINTELFVYDIYALYAESGTISHFHKMDIWDQVLPLPGGFDYPSTIHFILGCLNQELFLVVDPYNPFPPTASLFGYNMKTQKLREYGGCITRYSMYLHKNSILNVPKIFNNTSGQNDC